MLNEVVEWYGSQAEMARSLKVNRAAVSLWLRIGVLPPARAIQVEQQSRGKFRAVDLTKI
ncbi:DNA-binding transcriptional regulator Cro [uncultured Caudovirales phage]|uniref:DNA-binding transcriptional regulator Cro n=1 Tax=uncultured Caudovirales phage TaxID=2100421 RepID=A0A6J5M0L6_9CAUD|nr:DNA-binding transcriptional regulator Cro [uncultured Caudovirales phage]